MAHAASFRRRGDIQGLRAVAVALVVAYHAGISFPGGFVGVDVFFVISGYVITGVLLRELDDHGTVDFREFFLRRVRRLLPALGVMLALVLATGSLLSPPGGQQLTARTGVAAALFNANTYLMTFEQGYFDPGIELNALLHTWSLSVEEQFYLVFPFLILGFWNVGKRRSNRLSARQSVAGGFVAVATLSLVLALVLTYVVPSGSALGFYLAPARAWEFVAGAVLAVRPARIGEVVARAPSLVAATGASLVGWSSLAYDEATTFPGIAVLVPVIGTMLIIAAGEVPENRLAQLLARPAAQWVGDRSYGWYLWHWPALVYASALFPKNSLAPGVAAVLSLGIAVASYELVEQPIRHRSSFRLGASLRLAALCIALPLVGAVGLETAHRTFESSDSLAAFEPHADQSLGCGGTIAFGERDVGPCTWAVDDPEGVVVLIGDSQAGQLIEGFAAAMNQANYTAIAASHGGCPFVDLVVTRDDRPDDNETCRSFVAQSVPDLVEFAPDAVVIASATDRYLSRPEFDIFEPHDVTTKMDSPAAREQAWEAGLERTISTLTGAGIDVTVVHPIPRFPDWDPRGCAVGLWLLSDGRCGQDLPATVVRSGLASALEIERAVVRRTGSYSIDLFDEICADGTCHTRSSEGWIMRDGIHITVAASQRLAPQLRKVVAR